jgi:hypothetical protein
MTIGPAVTKRLPRQFDELLIALLPNKRQIEREGIAVPQIALFHEQLQAIWTLRAGAPAEGPSFGAIEDHVSGSLYHVVLLLPTKIARDFMVIAVARHFVSLSDDGSDRFRISFCDPSAGQKCGLHIVGRKDAQDSPNAGMRAVFSLGVLFVIDSAVLVWPNILATLKVEAEENRYAFIAGPKYVPLRMTLLQLHLKTSLIRERE